MKVILYMAITANGLIAREDGRVDWSSKEAWTSYYNICRRTGYVVIGRKTYEVMLADNELLKDCFYIVLTRKKSIKSQNSKIIFTDQPLNKILRRLEEKDIKEVCIAGGGQLNSLFMKEGFIDEIYLDVEPIVFGKGIQLFSPNKFEFKLRLLEMNNLNSNTIQLHYKVLK